MKSWRSASLLALIACHGRGGGGASSSATDGPVLALEGLTNNTAHLCVSGVARTAPQTFVVRNVSTASVDLLLEDVPLSRAKLTLSTATLGPGATATVTVEAVDAAPTAPFEDVAFDLSTRPTDAATVDGYPPPFVRSTSVIVRFQFDDRAYRLSTPDARLQGGQLGVLTWTTAGSPLPAPKLAFDGPFEEPRGDPSPLLLASGNTKFRIAGAGPLGQEVSGAIRVAKARCPGVTLPESAAIPVTGLRPDLAKQIATGLAHTCVLDTSGRVLCWGDNTSAQLARPVESLPAGTSALAMLVAPLGTGVTAIAAGRAHTCALRAGDVLCWGDSTAGQCGPGVPSAVAVPNKIPLGGAATSIVARGDRACAILADGSASCWGKTSAGAPSSTPTPLPIASGTVQLALGDAHQCMRTAAGDVACSGAAGRIGDGTTTPSDTPVRVGLSGAADLAAGATHTCVVTTGGELLCWGDVPNDRSTGMDAVLAPLANLVIQPSQSASRVTAAGRTTCLAGSAVICSDVALGEQDVKVSSLDTGGAHACFVFDGGKVACIGDDARQQGGLLGAGGVYGFNGP